MTPKQKDAEEKMKVAESIFWEANDALAKAQWAAAEAKNKLAAAQKAWRAAQEKPE